MDDFKDQVLNASKAEFKDDDFMNFENKVAQVMNILENMNADDPETQELGMKKADLFLDGRADFDKIDEDNFIVKVRENRSVINKMGGAPDGATPDQMDKFTFMQQMEKDAEQRAKVREERRKIAQNFRSQGNKAYYKNEFEKAINMYTKAIDHIKDSPILYNNRALCYMKLHVYKRAIIDCDFVINKLDDKNLRAWLYRAAAYYKLGDQHNFESSVKLAKKNNSKELDQIEKFITNVISESF